MADQFLILTSSTDTHIPSQLLCNVIEDTDQKNVKGTHSTLDHDEVWPITVQTGSTLPAVSHDSIMGRQEAIQCIIYNYTL